MARNLTCIVCPLGCRLTVTDPAETGDASAGSALVVSGNRCARGAAYAEEEIRAPKRMVTATCRIASAGTAGAGGAGRFDRPRRVPVKSSAPCPREYVDELIADIYALSVGAPVARGARLIENWKGRGIDVVAARSIE